MGAENQRYSKSIMGLIKPQQGNIALCGLSINRALKQNLVAYVPQAEEVELGNFQSPFMMCHDGALWLYELFAYSKSGR